MGGVKLKQKQNMIIFILALFIMFFIHFLPAPKPLIRGGEEIPLTLAGKTTIGILIFCIILWMTEAIPFAVTVLIGNILLPMFGIYSFSKVIQTGFGNTLTAFFLGVLTLGAAFVNSGLGKRLTLILLSKIGTKTERVILGFILVGTALSMWITDVAVAAMLTPLAIAILQEIRAEPLKSNFGRALLISCAWGGLFGGIGTPVGCGPNVLAMQMLREMAGYNLTFGQWMMIGVPAAFLLGVVGWIVLIKVFPPEIKQLPLSNEKIKKELQELGPLTNVEKKTLTVFCLAILLWLIGPFLKSYDIWGGFPYSDEYIALLAGILLFLPGIGVLNWKEAEREISWGSIVLIVGGVALGMAVYDTGAARWLAWVLLGPVTDLHPILRIGVISLVVGILHICFSSNSVTGVIIVPLVVTLAKDLGGNPWIYVAPAAFTMSLGLILVTETPTNVIPYSAGYFSIKDFAKAGIIMQIAAAICIMVVISIIGSLTGIYEIK
ncbi:MAG: DASS family sodium-coupled anion symporter [Thermanaeromonas sp.]|uniref:SLC13 family permease n=1 Tax=Thermanaeromonas sp. TaxID=2003697 RepID=UPI00243FC579|nr:DASS family sodium-coupled anion symporter [Thermanaeromonas sp.]MCG0277911.1 DASS family sodium-coupled anion symporter [Thermanaeromonas sp.]